MGLMEKYFPVLDALDTQTITTQRELSKRTGISLGQANFLLRSLSKKGLIKIKNFNKSPVKKAYLYLLTPEGVEAKSKLAIKFVLSKLKEYEGLRAALAERLTAVEEKGHLRFVFVGPQSVKDLMDSVVREKGMRLAMVGHSRDWIGLKEIDPESFDVALILDEQPAGVKGKGAALGIAEEKLLPLW
jgi:EPS-associated MarR family transcriptional regulator